MEKEKDKRPDTEGIPATFHFNAPVGQVIYNSTVTSYFDTHGNPKEAPDTKNQMTSDIDKSQLRDEIIEYVGRICEFYTSDWQKHYKELWNDILNMPVVDLKVYNRGKLWDTNFNRNLVGNIIGFLNQYNLYKETIVPAVFARRLAKDGKGKSVRDALGGLLDPEIRSAIIKLMESKKYF